MADNQDCYQRISVLVTNDVFCDSKNAPWRNSSLLHDPTQAGCSYDDDQFGTEWVRVPLCRTPAGVRYRPVNFIEHRALPHGHLVSMYISALKLDTKLSASNTTPNQADFFHWSLSPLKDSADSDSWDVNPLMLASDLYDDQSTASINALFIC